MFWTYNSAELFNMLVIERGWSSAAYGTANGSPKRKALRRSREMK